MRERERKDERRSLWSWADARESAGEARRGWRSVGVARSSVEPELGPETEEGPSRHGAVSEPAWPGARDANP